VTDQQQQQFVYLLVAPQEHYSLFSSCTQKYAQKAPGGVQMVAAGVQVVPGVSGRL